MLTNTKAKRLFITYIYCCRRKKRYKTISCQAIYIYRKFTNTSILSHSALIWATSVQHIINALVKQHARINWRTYGWYTITNYSKMWIFPKIFLPFTKIASIQSGCLLKLLATLLSSCSTAADDVALTHSLHFNALFSYIFVNLLLLLFAIRSVC